MSMCASFFTVRIPALHVSVPGYEGHIYKLQTALLILISHKNTFTLIYVVQTKMAPSRTFYSSNLYSEATQILQGSLCHRRHCHIFQTAFRIYTHSLEVQTSHRYSRRAL